MARRSWTAPGALLLLGLAGAALLAQAGTESSALRLEAPRILQPDMEWLDRLRAASRDRNWPQWRGPRRDGVSGEKLSADPWPGGAPRKLWSVPGGAGYAGVAVVGERAYTQVQQGGEEVVLCLRVRSGDVLWRHAVAARFHEPSAGTGPHSTPTVADGQVYVLGATGQFHCFDAATGAVLWRHDLVQEFQGGVPTYGASCAPLAVGDLIVVQPDGPFGGFLAAYDRRDGRLVWRTPSAPGGYSSPVEAVLAGRRQLVTMNGEGAYAVAPEDGSVLWRFPWKLDFNVATPIVSGDCVFISSGYGTGCALLRLRTGAGGALTVTPVYQNTRMKSHFQSAVLVQGRLYGFDDDFLACMDFATGELRWKQRGFGKGSVTAVDDRLLVLGDEGALAIVDARPDEYRERSRCSVASTRTWAPPTVAHGRLYIRDQERITCYELDSAPPAAATPRRSAWESSKVQGTPDPPPPYREAPAFPGLSFALPVDLVAVPGTDRMAVAELRGGIKAFRREPDVRQADLLIDLNRLVLGVAFHPGFASNGRVFVFNGTEDQSEMRVSRFVVKREAAWSIDPSSESVVIRWPSRGELVHVGGALRFGPDGKLYIGMGDGSAGMDADATGQNPGDWAASILRIDVDGDGGYRVPPDNPFVGRKDARPELWAYGIREPWKMSFDRATGDLWVGDVGEERWESVLRVRAGANYGWSAREGGHPFRPDRPPGPTPIESPVVVHPHSECRAVVGGAVYHGSRLPDLKGSYLYGDYSTGRVWELRLDGGKVVRNRELALTPLMMTALCGETGDELYLLNHAEGTIHILVPNTKAVANPRFPKKLSETGLFASVPKQQAAAGVVPYDVNAPLWSDGAAKDRWIAVPGKGQIRVDIERNLTVKPFTPIWDFPDGTVLVKTFSLDGRRVETRLLTLQDVDGLGRHGWRGYSYRWNAEQTDADLVAAAGEDVEVALPGRRQTWHYPSRAECLMCHTASAAFVLGVNTIQTNRDVDVPGRGVMNQLRYFESIGLFDAPLMAAPSTLPRLVDCADETQDLELRARSYLHANCAHCHIYRGGGNSGFQLQANLATGQTGVVDGPAVHGDFGLGEVRLVAPGDPARSMIFHRMGLTGAGRMPPTSSSVVDEAGRRVLDEWIRRVPAPDRKPRPSGPWPGPAFAGLALAGAAAWAGSRRAR